jgi:tetratricopeptide (TPR) repeat protein
MVEEYDSRAASDAKKILETLATELQNVNPQDGDAAFARRLLPFVHARLAYAYGTLYRLPGQVSPQLKDQAEKAWKDAKTSYKAVPESEWPSNEQKNDVWSWVLHAEGYASFRIAQWKLESAGEKGDRAGFKAESKEAQERIEEALRLRPTNYLFLHSLAIILDDERVDPDNKLLDEAQRTYERTIKLVPQDYYQYERLARLYWRRAKLHPEGSALWRETVAKGLEHVKAAETRRMPPTPTTVVCATYFLAASAWIETDEKKRTDGIQITIDKADQALRLDALTSPQRALIGKDAAKLMKELAAPIANKTTKDKLMDLAEKFGA